jgi:N-acetylglucosamine-6-phosphate deacetylase
MEYQKVASGFIKIVTVAPELADGIEFISEVSDMGVVCSIGHTNATADVIAKAVEAGAKSFTHWGNAMSQMDRLDVGALGMAMLGNTFVEVIPDGKHVSKDAIKLLLKAKGLADVVCVTDSIMATGLTDGDYTLGAQSVTVTRGDAYLTGTTTRAGSTLDAYQGLANIVEFCGLPLSKAIKLWTINPAKLIGMDKRIGTIEIGKDADFIIFGV